MSVRIDYSSILIKIMCLLGLTTLLSTLPFISTLNRLLMGIFMVILLIKLVGGCTKAVAVVILLTMFDYIYSLMQTEWPVQNVNELFYFGLWVLLFCNLINDYDSFVYGIKLNTRFMRNIAVICNVIVAVSFVIPSCYSNGFFTSFAGAQHRFSSSMLMVVALSALLMRIYGQKKYLLLAILPTMGVMISGARTYMLVIAVIAMCLYYIVTEHKSSFYLTIFPIALIVLYLVLNSDIMVQRSAEIERLGDYYGDSLRAMTSGRSVWLLIDLQHFWQSSWLNQIFGNGFHFIRYVNTVFYGQNIWAHNDFVQLLGTNGYLGLGLYLYVYIKGCSSISNSCTHNKKVFLLICFHSIIIFDAMLNMVYTYTSTTLAAIFLLIAFMDNENFAEIEIFRRRQQEEYEDQYEIQN